MIAVDYTPPKIYMIPVRPPPPLPPPNGSPPPPPRGVVWLWLASLPLLWCGVVWCGCGLFPPLGGSPLPPLWRGVGWVVPPCMFGSASGVW